MDRNTRTDMADRPTPVSPGDFLAADGLGAWRLLSDGAVAHFRTRSLGESAAFAAAIADLPEVADHPPAIDIRQAGVTVSTITLTEDYMGPSDLDVAAARAISAVAEAQGLDADPSVLQSLLLIPGAPGGVDVLPFWRAVLGYVPRPDSPDEDLVDPQGRGTPFWFEAMDAPRGDGGGAIHVAVWVPIEAAEARVSAALAAGGRMVRDTYAPTWWTLADAAGNEVDVATVSGRG
jgi:4a-hydroxytetrahydrobiopterin dehydratase